MQLIQWLQNDLGHKAYFIERPSGPPMQPWSFSPSTAKYFAHVDDLLIHTYGTESYSDHKDTQTADMLKHTTTVPYTVVYYKLLISSNARWRQNPKVYHRVHKSPPPVPILNQLNPLHNPPQPISLRSPLIPSSHLRLFFRSVSFLLAYPTKSCTLFSTLPCVPHALPTSLALTWSA
jgi:hypothetical protein